MSAFSSTGLMAFPKGGGGYLQQVDRGAAWFFSGKRQLADDAWATEDMLAIAEKKLVTGGLSDWQRRAEAGMAVASARRRARHLPEVVQSKLKKVEDALRPFESASQPAAKEAKVAATVQRLTVASGAFPEISVPSQEEAERQVERQLVVAMYELQRLIDDARDALGPCTKPAGLLPWSRRRPSAEAGFDVLQSEARTDEGSGAGN
jgi:hypothetical protein